MLEVGNMPSYAEDEAHFGLWCVTSSPLILGTPHPNLTPTRTDGIFKEGVQIQVHARFALN